MSYTRTSGKNNFFKQIMNQEPLANKIQTFLDDIDYSSLKSVSTDFNGPILRPTVRETFSSGFANAVFIPMIEEAKLAKSNEESIGHWCAVYLCYSPVLACQTLGYLWGAAVDVLCPSFYDETRRKAPSNDSCARRPFYGNHVRFLRPTEARRLTSEQVSLSLEPSSPQERQPLLNKNK